MHHPCYIWTRPSDVSTDTLVPFLLLLLPLFLSKVGESVLASFTRVLSLFLLRFLGGGLYRCLCLYWFNFKFSLWLFCVFCRPGFCLWVGRCSGAVVATDSLSKLSRKHGVKVGSLCSVKEVALAVGGDSRAQIHLNPPPRWIRLWFCFWRRWSRGLFQKAGWAKVSVSSCVCD